MLKISMLTLNCIQKLSSDNAAFALGPQIVCDLVPAAIFDPVFLLSHDGMSSYLEWQNSRNPRHCVYMQTIFQRETKAEKYWTIWLHILNGLNVDIYFHHY